MSFFGTLIVILNVVVMSDFSDLDFEGFLEGSFNRQHDTGDSDSNISLDEDISDSADHNAGDSIVFTMQ